MMRASIRLAIWLAALFGAAQISAKAESVKAWSRQFNVTYIIGMATFQAKLQANPHHCTRPDCLEFFG
jgi:hypothetical protein